MVTRIERLRAASTTATLLLAALLLSGCSAAVEEEPPFDLVDFPSADEAQAAEPGARFAQGEAAWLPFDGSNPDNLGGVALLEVITGDALYWDDFTNGDEFTDYTPYFIVIQHQRLTGNSSPSDFIPLLADGTEASAAQLADFMQVGAACPVELPYFDDPDQRLECVVGIDKTQPVVGFAWHNTVMGMNLDPENPWLDNPATWSTEY